MRPLILFCLIFLSIAATSSNETALRDQVLGTIIKGRVEIMHFSQKRMDKELSKSAFKQFLDRLDHGKQFLLKADVLALEKYQLKIDEELVSGDFALVREGSEILHKRIREVQSFVGEIFKAKKGFDFSVKEFLETDPKKRDYVKDSAELKELWRKMIKYAVLNQYIIKLQEQEESGKKKKGKKSLSPAKLQALAIEESQKNYARAFERLLKEDHDDELDRFFNAITTVFDPHTNYLPPQKKEDFDIEMKGSLEGIGAMLREDGVYIRVVKIIPGSASWKVKKLGPEDIILKVAQGKNPPVDIVGMRVTDAVKLIRVPKGTEVRLTVKRPSGEVIVVPITRETVQIEESYAKGAIIQNGKEGKRIGYIYLPRFYRDFEAQTLGQAGRNCTDDVKELVEVLNKQKIDGLVLDLRNNAGGALEDARLMTGLFVPFGPVVQVKVSGKKPEVLYDSDAPTLYSGRLVVLVNRFSASASEIVAAALQDYERAIIIGGDHTHGKGTVQLFLDLGQGIAQVAQSLLPLGALKVTIQKFYRVTGGSTQYKGVTPDIIFPDLYESLETGERYLDYSLPWDEVPPLKFQKWTKTPLNIPALKALSEKRVKENIKFKKITENLAILNKRKNETVVPLNLSDARSEQKKIKEETESFRVDDVNKKLVVFKLERKDKSKKSDWKVDLVPLPPENKLKTAKSSSLSEENGPLNLESEDWTLELRKDPVLEETLNVFQDWM